MLFSLDVQVGVMPKTTDYLSRKLLSKCSQDQCYVNRVSLTKIKLSPSGP